jgi:hypothetical protein
MGPHRTGQYGPFSGVRRTGPPLDRTKAKHRTVHGHSPIRDGLDPVSIFNTLDSSILLWLWNYRIEINEAKHRRQLVAATWKRERLRPAGISDRVQGYGHMGGWDRHHVLSSHIVTAYVYNYSCLCLVKRMENLWCASSRQAKNFMHKAADYQSLFYV